MDVKNEGRSDYVYDNKAHTTNCHAKNAAFYTKMHQVLSNRPQSSGRFVRTCTGCTVIGGTTHWNSKLGVALDLLGRCVKLCF
jgi:hypothetical protein